MKRNLRKAEWDHVNNVIQDGLNQNNTKPFWSYTKSKRQDNIGIAPLKNKGNLLTDAKSKANILLKQFISVFTRSTDSTKPKVGTFENILPISQISIDNNGVLKLLKRLDVHKAMGPDCIPNIVLKNCADEILQGLCTIFQHSLNTGTLPSDWRNANITPVFKKGDRHLAENYRPVSLTSVPCKILKHIICSHMLKHFEKHKILTTLNHGFRSGYSTETQLLVTMHDLLQANDARVQVDIAILDFSKAFDTVPHGKLLHKLDAYGIRGSLHKWLSSFLQDRQMRVVVEGEHSESAPVESGVPQGTVLGPLMFLCHINDLPDTVKSQVRLFADDCLLYRQIKNQNDHLILQNDLNELEKWAAKWGMRFNAKKCYILSIRQKSSSWFDSYLSNRFQQVHISGKLSESKEIKAGVPHGSVLGPLLFLLYINDLPLYIKYCLLDLFADDGTLHTSNSYLPTVTNFLNLDLDNFSDWCDDNDMKKNTSKSKAMFLATRCTANKIMAEPPHLTIKGEQIQISESEKLLGVHINNSLSWSTHIDSTLKKCNSLLFLLNRIKKYLNIPTRKLFYNAYILPHLDYCCSVWGNANTELMTSIIKFQKRAARSSLDKPIETSSEELFAELKWMTFPERVMYQKAILMYKIMHNLTPAYLTNMFTFSKEVHDRTLRSTADNLLYIPKPNIEHYRNSLAYSGSKIWNSIPNHLRNAVSLQQFRKGYLEWAATQEHSLL